MKKYVLDTNLYVHAARDITWWMAVRDFLDRNMPGLYLHATVAGELLAGSCTPKLERDTQRNLIAPFEATGRVITPSLNAWKRAGPMLARLVRGRSFSPNGVPRSMFNDCVIAVSAREHGVTIVTDNLRDFELIATVAQVDFIAPWPDRQPA